MPGVCAFVSSVGVFSSRIITKKDSESIHYNFTFNISILFDRREILGQAKRMSSTVFKILS